MDTGAQIIICQTPLRLVKTKSTLSWTEKEVTLVLHVSVMPRQPLQIAPAILAYWPNKNFFKYTFMTLLKLFDFTNVSLYQFKKHRALGNLG